MPDLPPALDDLIDASPAPAWCRVSLARIVEEQPGAGDRLAADGHVAEAVVAVCGISNSLTRLLHTDPGALDVLADLDHRPAPPAPGAGADGLVAWKGRELLRLAARDQLGLDRLEETGAALSALATDVLEAARVEAGGDGLLVVGMGKLGGGELNYASDVDVLFACADDADATELARAAQSVLDVAGRCFRVDANLRPEGRNGALVRSIAGFDQYWERWAEPWEFQALLKARPAAGPPAVGAAFAEAAAARLWARAFEADDLRSLRALKARAEAEVRKTAGDREVKRAPGGIRDVEFTVQLLQLVHGRSDPDLRDPNTLRTLGELGAAGYVDAADADALADAYRFLRDVEHRLQLVEEQQVYAVPAGAEPRTRLARSLGLRDTPEAGALAAFDERLALTKGTVRAIHERVYFRPLLEAFAGLPGAMGTEAVAARLAAFGFRDADRTREAIAELTRGLTRSSRLMDQLLPVMLGWLSDTPDPDLGLLALRRLVSGPRRSNQFAGAFRDNPEGARRLCTLVGTSRLVGEQLDRNPDLAAALADDRRLQPPTETRLAAKARTALEWRDDPADRQAGLRRFTDREGLRVAAADVLGLLDEQHVGAALSRLAAAAVQAGLDSLAPDAGVAVVALGRFAGGELSYASDLDVVVVHDDAAIDAGEAAQLAGALLGFLNGDTPARRVYRIDADLRPEGRNGVLSRSVDAYVAYFERWAQPWERQAYSRARPVAGDVALGQQLVEALHPFVWEAPLTPEDVRELRRIKARVEKERIPAGEDPQFHLKLGPGSLSDVEWATQLLQLRSGIESPSTLEGIALLRKAGMLSDQDADVLDASYRFCERTRNRWHLVNGTAGDALPQQADQLGRLARSLGTSPRDLREEYRRVTRRAREAFERLFYGRT